jgi:hypothetical protein
MFFRSYFRTLDEIVIKIPCFQSAKNPKDLGFDMNYKISDNRSIENLKTDLQVFKTQLNNQTEKEKIELKFKNEMIKSNFDITIDFTSTFFSYIENAINKTNGKFCKLVTCYNDYFNRTCDETNIYNTYACVHVCDLKEYCKNRGICLPSYADAFKPKCE